MFAPNMTYAPYTAYFGTQWGNVEAVPSFKMGFACIATYF